ncbi:hypothetical protein [Erwinia sp. CGal63]|uniref:hypothetical protein n=1 Tax=Erwinia sp. CGal63 TaxID=2919889 RepID=UPI0030091093
MAVKRAARLRCVTEENTPEKGAGEPRLRPDKKPYSYEQTIAIISKRLRIQLLPGKSLKGARHE